MSGRHGHDHDHDHAGHDHGHEHSHDDHDHAGHAHVHSRFGPQGNAGLRALWIALVVNGAFMGVELVVGLWSRSLALVSDAGHMLTDVLALGIAVVGAVMRARPRSSRATFGHARVAVLGGFINGALALAVAAFIIVEAAERTGAPPDVMGLPVLVTAAIGLVVNLGSAFVLHRSGDHSLNMRGAMLHMLGDALGSVAAIIAGAVIVLGGPAVVDVIVSVVVAGIIAASALPLMRDASVILLERAPAHVDVDAVKTAASQHAAVRAAISLHVWSLDDGTVAASFVLETDVTDLAALAVAADTLRATLKSDHGVAHAVFEWRPVGAATPCC